MQFYPTPPAPSGHMRQGSDIKLHNSRASINVIAPVSAGTAVSRARIASEYASLRYPVQSPHFKMMYTS
jgi:hypothetical protein